MKCQHLFKKWSEHTNIILTYNDREVQDKPERVYEMHGDGNNP